MSFFICVVIPLQATKLIKKLIPEIAAKMMPSISIGNLYFAVHENPKNIKIQTRFPGVFEYLWIQWKGNKIIMNARATEINPYIMTNLCKTLLLAQELYSAIPTIPKITMIPANIKSIMKTTKKKILGKWCEHLVTIIAIMFMNINRTHA